MKHALSAFLDYSLSEGRIGPIMCERGFTELYLPESHVIEWMMLLKSQSEYKIEVGYFFPADCAVQNIQGKTGKLANLSRT